MKKFKYIVGLRPTPRIAMYQSANLNILKNLNSEMNNKFNINYELKLMPEHIHIWNSSAYIIYNEITLEIINIAFNEFSNAIFLFRYINKEIWANFDLDIFEIFEKESQNFPNEFILSV